MKFNKITANSVKKILKTIKLNESSISMVLGAIVLVIVGSYIVNYLKTDRGTIPEELLSGINSIESDSKIHTVKSGDNLWNLAVTYYGDGFKWVDIATENKLENASIIEVGEELIIPKVNNEYEKITVNDAEQVVLKNGQKIESDTYTVAKGDSLWSIAVRTYGDGYQWTKIAKENNLSHPNLIHVGNVLNLPL